MAGRNGRSGGAATQEKEKASPPVWSRKRWSGTANIEVAVFEKVVNEGKDDEFIAYNVSAKRTYKDDEGYKSVQGFRAEDMGYLIALLQQADAFISEQMNRE